MLNDEEQLYDIYYKEKYVSDVSEEVYQILVELQKDLDHTENTNIILKEKLKLYQDIGKKYNIYSSEELDKYISQLKNENDYYKTKLVNIIINSCEVPCTCNPCIAEEEIKKVLFHEKK